MLTPCSGLFGDCQIDATPPTLSTWTGAIYVPQRGLIDRDHEWGLYDETGCLIEGAAYRRGPGRILIGQSERIELPPDIEPVEGEMIYGGAVHGHYGHFLLGMLPRFWLDFEIYRDVKILLHSVIDLDLMFTIPFMREILTVLGLDRSRFVMLDRPSRIERVLVPDSLFHEQSSAKPLFAQLCQTINARFNPPTPRTRQAVYLSKEKLTGGVWNVANESVISSRLASRGVDIVFPEQMPLREQMTLFERYETVCGLMGSALHTSIFARDSNRIIGLTHNPFVVTNYLMIDRLKGNRADYVFPETSMTQSQTADGFSSVFECPEPEAVADELIEMIGA